MERTEFNATSLSQVSNWYTKHVILQWTNIAHDPTNPTYINISALDTISSTHKYHNGHMFTRYRYYTVAYPSVLHPVYNEENIKKKKKCGHSSAGGDREFGGFSAPPVKTSPQLLQLHSWLSPRANGAGPQSTRARQIFAVA